MCLAIPGKIIACDGDEITVDMQGNQLTISRVLTPEAGVGDWVLSHAGFAISQIDEAEALETWEWLKVITANPEEEAGGDAVSEAGS